MSITSCLVLILDNAKNCILQTAGYCLAEKMLCWKQLLATIIVIGSATIKHNFVVILCDFLRPNMISLNPWGPQHFDVVCHFMHLMCVLLQKELTTIIALTGHAYYI